jgi:hypothetical protein
MFLRKYTSSSTNQETRSILWYTNFCYPCLQKSQLVPIFSLMNPYSWLKHWTLSLQSGSNILSYAGWYNGQYLKSECLVFFEDAVNIFLSTTYRSSKLSLFLIMFHVKHICISVRSTRAAYSVHLILLNLISWVLLVKYLVRNKNMKLLIMKFSQASCYVLPHRSKYRPQHPTYSRTLSLYVFPLTWQTKSHAHVKPDAEKIWQIKK